MIRTYLFTGFIESGKTSFIQDTLMDPSFCENEKTLLIVFEEGEVSYNEEALSKNDVSIEYLSKDDCTKAALIPLIDKYKPTQIMVEMNGMSNVAVSIDVMSRVDMQVVQVLTTHNAQTFDMYYSNMRSIMIDQSRYSDLIIFNRCDENTKKYALRSAMKATNTKAQIVFENVNNEIEQITAKDLPFDISDNYLDIPDMDFGIFCLDIMENPRSYENKTIKLTGQFKGLDKFIENGFVLARDAMVCCEQDMQIIGIICISKLAKKLIKDEWLTVEGSVEVINDPEEGYEIPILHLDKLEGTKPLKDPTVNFN
ncbi:MAG: GTP-binding protein [Thomasclavelia sp.]|jgi:putative membrane protein|nr:GTP-binding protein [Thomasclavelia sp.]